MPEYLIMFIVSKYSRNTLLKEMEKTCSVDGNWIFLQLKWRGLALAGHTKSTNSLQHFVLCYGHPNIAWSFSFNVTMKCMEIEDTVCAKTPKPYIIPYEEQMQCTLQLKQDLTLLLSK